MHKKQASSIYFLRLWAMCKPNETKKICWAEKISTQTHITWWVHMCGVLRLPSYAFFPALLCPITNANQEWVENGCIHTNWVNPSSLWTVNNTIERVICIQTCKYTLFYFWVAVLLSETALSHSNCISVVIITQALTHRKENVPMRAKKRTQFSTNLKVKNEWHCWGWTSNQIRLLFSWFSVCNEFDEVEFRSLFFSPSD